MNTEGKSIGYRWLLHPIERNHSVLKNPIFFRIHAATLEIDEKIIVFAGHSGQGKSTVYRILTEKGWRGYGDDEAVVLFLDNKQWVLHDALVTLNDDSVISAEKVHKPIGLMVYLRNHLTEGFSVEPCPSIKAARLGFKRLFLSLLPEWEIMFRNISQFSRDIPAVFLDFSLTADFSTAIRNILSP